MGFSSTLVLGQQEVEGLSEVNQFFFTLTQGQEEMKQGHVKFRKQEQQEKEQGDCRTSEMAVTPLDFFSPLFHPTQQEEQEKEPPFKIVPLVTRISSEDNI